MKNYRLQTTDGVRDYLGNDVITKKIIENKTLDFLLSYGYQLIKTPTFEYVDVFKAGKDVHQQPELYNLINRQGEFLALRSDMTASIARVVATKDNNDIVPKKYCYLENTFRYPVSYQGKSHEFTQAGIELIGIKSFNADVEVIKILVNTLKENDIDKFTIHIGSSKFIDTLFQSLNLSYEEYKEISNIIENKDFVSLESYLLSKKIDNELIELITYLMRSAGRISFLERLETKIKDKKIKNIIKELEELYLKLVEVGLKDYIVFDFSIYAYAKYYTGILFQVFADGLGKALAVGGRYDNLLKEFGCLYPAVGFGLDIDSLCELVKINNLLSLTNDKYLSFNVEKSEISEVNNQQLRKCGAIVEESLFINFEDTLNYAKQKGINKIIKYFNNNFEIINVESNL